MSIALETNQLIIKEILILVLAAIADYTIGDPQRWLHPVQVMGWLIQKYTDLAVKLLPPGGLRRIAGIWLGLGLIIGSGLVGQIVVASLTATNYQTELVIDFEIDWLETTPHLAVPFPHVAYAVL